MLALFDEVNISTEAYLPTDKVYLGSECDIFHQLLPWVMDSELIMMHG